jgi:hypothetical protein
MEEITFSCKVDSLKLESDQDYSEVILKNVSFTLHEGSLDEINKAILFEKPYLVTLREIQRI